MMKISIMILLTIIILFLIYKFLQPKNKEFFYRKFRNPGDGPSDSQIERNRAAYAEQQRQELLKTQEQKDAEKAAKDAENARINADIKAGLAKRDKIIQDSIDNIKLTNTASWLKTFIVQNDAAKKFGNRLKVSEDRHLYLDDKDLGYSDDFPNHVGNLRDNTGYYVPIEAIFTLIAGPDNSKDECFDFLGIGGAITSAYDWSKDRVNDAANFADKAVNSIGDWAKNLSSEVLNWCKTVGQNFAKSLIDFGNKIGCIARKIAKEIADTVVNTLNKIKDFFKGILGQIKELINKMTSWVTSNAETVWNNSIKDKVSKLITIILQGSQCEYIANLDISDSEAFGVIEPYLYPELRPPVKHFLVNSIDIIMPELMPFIELIVDTGLLNEYLDPELDKLIKIILNQFTHDIVLIITPLIKTLSWTCDWMNLPNIDDISINDSSADSLNSNTDWI